MGYYIELEDHQFVIKADKHAAALAAGKEMADPQRQQEGGTGFSFVSGPNPVVTNHWRWLGSDEIVTASTLAELMSIWRFDPEIDPATGDIVGVRFEGQKIGDEDEFFKVIAPFVEAGSWIHMSGEDGAQWRWYFDGETCTEQPGRVVFDVPDTDQEAANG